MAVQDSTFRTVHVEDNEIIKANDFEFAFEQLVENVSKATQMFLESTQDFVINGSVIPSTGMNVAVSPIFGVCKSTGQPFGRTETTDETIGFEGSSSGRIDIIQVRGEWATYDNQQRAFNDPDTDTQTYQYVDTKKLMKPVYQVKQGIEGAGVAPEKDSGWVKLAEVSIRAGATSILATDIHNITADVAGMDNDDWTTEKSVTYNIGYISDVNARFRVQHNEDGTHADDCIDANSLDIGTGVDQINGNILPVGATVSIPNETISAADSILSVLTKAASLLTSLYNDYLKYGSYGFKGELNISSVLDANNDLEKPITVAAAGDGTAVIKVDGNAVISIDANGKLSTNGYTASSNNHIVTKIVTDSLKTLIDGLDARVTAIENTSDTTVYANNTLSSGTDGRYNVDNTAIYAATTTNITLSGAQAIDGVTPTNGVYILVKDQTDKTQNGIYQYSSSSTWTRVNTYLSPNSLKAKIFNVSNGTNNGGKMFYLPRVNFTDGSSFGTDDIIFSEYFGSIAAKANKLVMRDSNGKVNSDVNGNASTATSAGKWTTARNISISDSDGTNTGSAVSVDGSANKTLKLPGTIKATLSGSATSAGKLTTSRKVYVKLATASTSETKDFSGDTAIPVNGTLQVGNGGTGQTNLANVAVGYSSYVKSSTNTGSGVNIPLTTAKLYDANTDAKKNPNAMVYVTKHYADANGGYIVYSNGLKIQWKRVSFTSAAVYKFNSLEIPLLFTSKDTACCFVSAISADSNSFSSSCRLVDSNHISGILYGVYQAEDRCQGMCIYAIGY